MPDAPPAAIRRHECQRHSPKCAPAEIGRENADRDHRKDMVDAAHRMAEAVSKAERAADAGMREGERRSSGQRPGQGDA